MLSDSFIDFDGYWERYRERIENPPRHPWDEQEPEEDLISFDEDEAYYIATKYGRELEDLDEYDLMEIVKNVTGINAISAEYDKGFDCIVFKHDAA